MHIHRLLVLDVITRPLMCQLKSHQAVPRSTTNWKHATPQRALNVRSNAHSMKLSQVEQMGEAFVFDDFLLPRVPPDYYQGLQNFLWCLGLWGTDALESHQPKMVHNQLGLSLCKQYAGCSCCG